MGKTETTLHNITYKRRYATKVYEEITLDCHDVKIN